MNLNYYGELCRDRSGLGRLTAYAVVNCVLSPVASTDFLRMFAALAGDMGVALCS